MKVAAARPSKSSLVVSQIVVWLHVGILVVSLPFLLFAPIVVIGVVIELAIVLPLAWLIRRGHDLAALPLGAWLCFIASQIWWRNRPGLGEITDSGHYQALCLAGALAMLGVAAVACGVYRLLSEVRRLV